jgi:hypothetical protein
MSAFESIASLCLYPTDVRFPPGSVRLPRSAAPKRLTRASPLKEFRNVIATRSIDASAQGGLRPPIAPLIDLIVPWVAPTSGEAGAAQVLLTQNLTLKDNK